ncbi:hypothetical protein Tco_1073559 [Tanacetum coccineum]
MADKGKKSSMETFAPNDKAYYYSGITSITVNGKNAYELKGKFLDDLHNNAFSGTNGKDAIWTDLQKILWGLKPMKITKTIGSMNGTKIYHGLKLEFGQNQNQSNILANLSTINLGVRNGQPVVGEKMVIVIEEICLVLTILETYSITKTLNEEYVAVKEDEYDDLTITSEEACQAYQEIFWMMDEGWMVTRTE